MTQESVLATIKSKFDHGYIVVLEDGKEAQLRVLEQRGRELKYHVAGTEEQLYGGKISVYVIYQDERYCSVSQFSLSERKDREEIENKKNKALESCEIGNKYTMEVEKDYDWGYLCCQVDGFLSGAIKKPTVLLKFGQHVEVVVVSKNKRGAPYFEVQGTSNA